MSKVKQQEITIENFFEGTHTLEELLIPFILHEIDKHNESLYDGNKASATPKGVAN